MTLLFISLLFASCAILPTPDNPSSRRGSDKTAAKKSSAETDTAGSSQRKSAKEVEDIKKKLIEGAALYRGARNLIVRDKRFNMDCSGTIAAIYYYAGIDLQKYYPDYTGTGTERVYQILNDRKLIKKTWLPEPGDIIFWDNTFDLNKNNKDDDLLTHMGMVVSADKNGNITYIHYHNSLGIVYEVMNIRKKNTHREIVAGRSIVVNSPMRMKDGNRGNKPWLSGQLVNSFGEAYHLD